MEHCMRNKPILLDDKCDHCKKYKDKIYPDSSGEYLCFDCWFIYHPCNHPSMTFDEIYVNTQNKND